MEKSLCMSYTDKQKNPVEAYHFHGISIVRQNTLENQKSSYLFVLVELRGIEPLSENNLTGLSPGAVCYLHSLGCARTDTLTASVESLCMGESTLSRRTVTTQITP